jgi:hypothetical protein
MSKSQGREGGPDDAAYAAAPSDAVFVGVAVSDGTAPFMPFGRKAGSSSPVTSAGRKWHFRLIGKGEPRNPRMNRFHRHIGRRYTEAISAICDQATLEAVHARLPIWMRP